MSKSKKMAKKPKPIQVVSVAASISLTHPEVNKLQWTFPSIPSERKIVYTYIDFRVVGAVGTKDGGRQIAQWQIEPDVTEFDNDVFDNDTNADDIGNGAIPAGTWDVRVSHFTAVGNTYNFDPATIDGGHFSEWITATFD